MGIISIYLKMAAVFGVAAVVILFSYDFLKNINDNSARATIIIGVITILGTIFTTMLTEITSYYQQKRVNLEKKWDLIFPLVKRHYNPWLNSAKSLQNAFRNLKNDKSLQSITRTLYLIMVFYSYRLKLVINEGSIILLMTKEEQEKADKSYRALRNSLNWAGNETPLKVSQLQNLFITKDKPDDPYVLHKFDLEIKSDANLNDTRTKLKDWVQFDKNLTDVDEHLEEFIKIFQDSINKLYSTLST